MKILIIDDSVEYLKVISAQLEKYGHEVKTELKPARGLIKILNNEIDIALIDFLMPEMDGLQVLEGFISEKPFFPAILLTAFGSSTLAVEWLKKGGSDYIEKPIGSFEILDLKIRLAVSQSILNQNNHQNKSWVLSNDILSSISSHIEANVKNIKKNLNTLRKESFWKEVSPLETYIDSIEKISIKIK
ncbi:MAG: response regulator [Spirochaetia bacterium]|nr:response regulator [Spirochaetia bacterium]